MDRYEKLYRQVRTSYDVPRPHLKRSIAAVGFFRYLFRERGKILRWNAGLGLIKPGFLGLSIRLQSSFKLRLDDLYVSQVLPVAAYLKEILDNGWQNQALSIKEYNLIVCFEDLAMKLASFERERQFVPKRFRLVEESFLRLVSNERHVRVLMDGLVRIFDYYRKKLFRKDDDPSFRLSKLNSFFAPGATSPSVYDIITAYNIVEASRYLEFQDIIAAGIRDVVSARFYDCSLDVFTRIVKYISGLWSELQGLEAGKKKIVWLKEHFSVHHSSTPQALISFYQSLGHVWKTDTEDVFLLLLLLLDGVIGRIENALAEVWRVMDQDERIINLKLVTTGQITETLKAARDEHELAYSKHSVVVPVKATLDLYMENKLKEKPFADETQSYISKRIENVFSLLRTLAEQFNDLYEKRNTDSARSLNYMIESPEKWRGKPVYDVYFYYIELILGVCGFFKEKKLMIELGEETEIDKQIAHVREKIKWTKDSNDIIIKAITSKEWSDPA